MKCQKQVLFVLSLHHSNILSFPYASMLYSSYPGAGDASDAIS